VNLPLQSRRFSCLSLRVRSFFFHFHNVQFYDSRALEAEAIESTSSSPTEPDPTLNRRRRVAGSYFLASTNNTMPTATSVGATLIWVMLSGAVTAQIIVTPSPADCAIGALLSQGIATNIQAQQGELNSLALVSQAVNTNPANIQQFAVAKDLLVRFVDAGIAIRQANQQIAPPGNLASQGLATVRRLLCSCGKTYNNPKSGT
jgi:hypothetical protein